MAYSIKLPQKADITSVGALRDEWLNGLQSQTNVDIDCASVEFIGASAAQLIVSLTTMVKPSGGSVKLSNVKQSLREDFILYGLQQYVEELT